MTAGESGWAPHWLLHLEVLNMERRIPEWHGWYAARRGLRMWCQARAQGLLEQIPGSAHGGAIKLQK